MLNVFSKGRRKSYDCFTIEVQLKNRTLWAYRSTYPYSQRKGVPPPRVSAQPRGHRIFVAKILGNFQCDDFFEEISKLPTNKDLAFETVPFSLYMLRDIYADTNAKPCKCSEAINKLAVTILKYRGKTQVNTRVKGISHI